MAFIILITFSNNFSQSGALKNKECTAAAGNVDSIVDSIVDNVTTNVDL
jgi:hypothetical protein